MQYLGDYRIDDYVSLGVQLHRFSSGAVYAPTGNVTYTFYENNSTSGAPTGGNLAQLNSKTGLYSARVQLTTAAGFEAGKEYFAHIEATVDSVAAGELFMFRVVSNPKVDVDTIKTQTVTCGAGVTVLASVGTAATSTAQTGDGYAIVNSGTHGNAALKTLIDAVDDYVDTEIADIQARLPAALTGAGNMKVDVLAWLGTTVATPTIAGVPEVDMTHAVGNSLPAGVLPNAVAGAAGGLFIAGTNAATTITTSLTTTFTGNLTGTIGGLSAGALADMFDTDSGTTYASAVAGSVVKEIADNAGGSALTADAIADAVWDEDATAHQTGGTFGQAIGDPGADTTTIYESVVTDAAGTNIAADIVAIKAETASIQSDTNDIHSRLPAALTGDGNIKADVLALFGNTGSAQVLSLLNSASVVYTGTVTGAATTTTLIDADLTETDADWWKGRIIIFTSVIPLQATDITGFDPVTDELTFTAVTQAPTGATYVII